MKKYFIISTIFILALSFVSCSKKPAESMMKEKIISYLEKREIFKAEDLDISPDKSKPPYGVGMEFFSEVKVNSIEFVDSQTSTDGNAYKVTVVVSGSAVRYINTSYKDPLVAHGTKDKSVSFSNSKRYYEFKKDKYGDWYLAL